MGQILQKLCKKWEGKEGRHGNTSETGWGDSISPDRVLRCAVIRPRCSPSRGRAGTGDLRVWRTDSNLTVLLIHGWGRITEVLVRVSRLKWGRGTKGDRPQRHAAEEAGVVPKAGRGPLAPQGEAA